MNITKTEKEIEVKKVVKQNVYTLELNEKELFALRYIADFIGGDFKGPRGVFDSLSKSINAINPSIPSILLNQKSRFLHDRLIQERGEIYFIDNWPFGFKEDNL